MRTLISKVKLPAQETGLSEMGQTQKDRDLISLTCGV